MTTTPVEPVPAADLEAAGLRLPPHLTINTRDDIPDSVSCDLCDVGVHNPYVIAAFVVLHFVHAPNGRACGLSETGQPTRAAERAFAALNPDPEPVTP